MPGLVVFGRRWGIASDDFVFPGLFELVVRVLWYVTDFHYAVGPLNVSPISLNDIHSLCSAVLSSGGLAP